MFFYLQFKPNAYAVCTISGRLAQSAEHRANNARVVGSSPTLTRDVYFLYTDFFSVFVYYLQFKPKTKGYFVYQAVG